MNNGGGLLQEMSQQAHNVETTSNQRSCIKSYEHSCLKLFLNGQEAVFKQQNPCSYHVLFEHGLWNAIAFLCCKSLVYFVKRWVTLSEKHINLSIRCDIMLKVCVVLSTQCLIMLKGHVVMINARVVISTQCLIMLKGYGVMLNSRVVLSIRSLIMLNVYVFMLKIGLSCLPSM